MQGLAAREGEGDLDGAVAAAVVDDEDLVTRGGGVGAGRADAGVGGRGWGVGLEDEAVRFRRAFALLCCFWAGRS